jgi:hypothetical protein
LVAPAAIFPLLGSEHPGVLEVEERIFSLVADEDHAPAVPAVSAGRAPKGDVGLATKRRAAISACAGLDREGTFVNEAHAGALSEKTTES